MSETLASAVERFLASRRALGRKYRSEESELRLLLRFAGERGTGRLDQLTPALLEEFLVSRPRSRPRSFNHLLGVLACLMDRAVAQELLAASPLRVRRRRVTSVRVPFLFDPAQVRRLLDAAGALPDNSRAAQRGPTYRTIFALCYGLGLRAGEACGLRLGDVDVQRNLLVVVGGKFGKSRLVPHGPRIASLVGEQLQRRQAAGAPDAGAPLFSFDGCRCVSPGTASQVFHRLVTSLELPVPTGYRRRACTVCVTHSRSPPCCAGTATGSTRRAGCTSYPPSWATLTRPPQRSTSPSLRRCCRRPTGASRPSPHQPGQTGRRRDERARPHPRSGRALLLHRPPHHRVGARVIPQGV